MKERIHNPYLSMQLTVTSRHQDPWSGVADIAILKVVLHKPDDWRTDLEQHSAALHRLGDKVSDFFFSAVSAIQSFKHVSNWNQTPFLLYLP